jgi:hypothetical protein
MSPRSLLGAVFPLVAIALVVLASLAPADDAAPAQRSPGTVAVSQSTYACPAGSVITVASGQVKPGTSGAARALPGRAPVDGLSGATTWRTSVVDGAGVLVDQQGSGSGAVGYFAGTAPRSGGGGLVVGSCSGVVDDAWLLGLGSGDEHFSTVILTNLAGSPAAVDLTLWGPEGRIDAVNAEGIVVEPYSVQRIRLDALAAGEPEVAVHVHRRRGSVSAVVNDTSTAAGRGTEPISASRPPSREQVVGGVVPGTGGRTLLVLNPGRSTARVGVEVIGSKSTFTPAGLEEVTVPAGTLRAVTVPSTAGSDAQALRVTSDQPVSASVRMAPTANDYAYAESSATLTGPAVVPVDLGQPGVGSQLVLTAPGRDASVEVQAFDAAMAPLTSTTISIPAGTTTATPVEVAGAAYLVLRPTGDVVAAATYSAGDRISSLAVTDAPVSVAAPQVRPVG